MQIIVRSIKEDTIIEIDVNDTIAMLKERIQDELGVPPWQQRLRLDRADTTLDDDHATLHACGIKPNIVVYLWISFAHDQPVST